MGFGKKTSIIFGIVAIVALAYGFSLFNNPSSGPVTGHASLGLNSFYHQGDPLNGTLSVSLKEGEFLPAASKIVIEDGNKSVEYQLSELVSETPSQGSFYIDGKQISGSGDGYGIGGARKLDTIVYFTLDVSRENSPVNEQAQDSTQNSQDTSGSSSSSSDSSPSQEQAISENPNPETQEQTQVPTETASQTTPSAPETPGQTSSQASSSSNPLATAASSQQPTTPSPSVSESSSSQANSNQNSNNGKGNDNSNSRGSSSGKSSQGNDNKENNGRGKASKRGFTTTGNTVIDFSRGIYGSFLRLAGLATLSLDANVEGQVSKGQEFSYSFDNGQEISIVPGSVRTNSGTISDDSVSLKISGNQAIVTTDYSGEETGFGQDYLGDGEKTIPIDLSSIGFVPEGNGLKISLVYENEEILSLSSNLVEGILTGTNITIANETEINTTKIEIILNVTKPELTEEERQALINEFGENSSIEITKAEKTDKGYVVRLEIGGFWTEHTYPLGYSTGQLQEQVGNDRILFLKDIAANLLSKQSSNEEVSGLIGSYGI